MTDPSGPGSIMRHTLRSSLIALSTTALLLPALLAAQSVEGSKWTVDQEGVDTPVLWWLGSQGRVRTGDIGSILPGYKWRQAGDSVIVTVGDTVRYAAILMSNRLVGVRTGPRRQEGWWSGARADGPTAVAATSTTPQVNPPAPGTETMSRPTDQPAANPVTPTTASTTGNPAPRQIRRIERADGQQSDRPAQANPNPGEGREIRRLPRPNARANAAAGVAMDVSSFLGSWVHTNPNTGIRVELRADSTFTYVRRDATTQNGRWTTDGTGLVAIMDLIGGDAKEVLVRRDGARLTMQPRGGLLSMTFDRASAGAEREPAVRRP
jgi:hypothetical protein